MKKIFFVLSLSTVNFFSFPAFCADNLDYLTKMTVRGEASIYKPADQMEVDLGVVTMADNASQASDENNKKIDKIFTDLKTLGLDERDYQTGNFHIQPIYQDPYKDAEEKKHKISQYEAVNAIKIKTQKLGLVDRILSTAVKDGVNQITQITFSLSNPHAYRGEAIKLATKYAMDDAANLAAAANVKIKRILDLSLDYWHVQPQRHMLGSARYETDGPMQSLAYNSDILEPGDTEIHVSVSIVFEIGQ